MEFDGNWCYLQIDFWLKTSQYFDKKSGFESFESSILSRISNNLNNKLLGSKSDI